MDARRVRHAFIDDLVDTPGRLLDRETQRPGNAPNPVVVTFGSQNLGTFTPSSTAFQLITVNFTPSSTSGVLQFQSAATTNGDLDTAIDQVSLGVSAVPEPAMYIPTALIGAGLMVFGRFRRRK